MVFVLEDGWFLEVTIQTASYKANVSIVNLYKTFYEYITFFYLQTASYKAGSVN